MIRLDLIVLTGALSLRQVDDKTIAVEVEKQHFMSMTRAPADQVTFDPAATRHRVRRRDGDTIAQLPYSGRVGRGTLPQLP